MTVQYILSGHLFLYLCSMNELVDRILILDGAMGTMLQRLGDSSDESIEKVHRLYIEAGADIIETNSFNLKGYDDSLKYARIARKAADDAERKILVAGSMGPFNKMLSLSDDAGHPENRAVSFLELSAIYKENAAGLIDGGVDLLLMETIFDPLNAKAALYAIASLFDERGIELPVMISATINDRGGHLLTGTDIEDFYEIVNHFPIWSFGLNCSFGASEMAPTIERISAKASCFVSMHPNAGLPDKSGAYSQTPEEMAQIIASLAKKGCINIAGGCCGTTPEHIKAIKQALTGIPARNPRSAGSEKAPFVNVGERTNVAGSRKFARLIGEKNYEEASRIARQQVEDGASVIDINMDDPMLDAPSEMEKFIRYVSNDATISKAAFMIDSSSWEVLEKGLQNAPGKVIVNSISLKDGEKEFLRRAGEIKKYCASVVVMAFDEQGQATSYSRKIEIFRRSYDLLTEKVGFNPHDIILDGNILTIATGRAEDSNHAVDFIEAVRWAKQNLPGVLTSGGVSNLSFAFRGNNRVREAMHTAFLYHAISAGLDMAIVNPSMLEPYNEIAPDLLAAVEDVILNRNPKAAENLIGIASETGKVALSVQEKESWRNEPCGKRLRHAMVNGTEEFLKEDLEEALKNHSALAIVENILLKGMEEVGEMFGQGKMFLPQVVKSARTMKVAVDILEPHISKENKKGATRKKMVIATVKGDVHDIGKNILSIVLSCNGIEVIDLGVMVENEAILKAIQEEKADFVGVSGLISPSLKEMEKLAVLLENSGVSIPLFIGGATTNALHTALHIAPLYSGCTVHTGSASECASQVVRMGQDMNSAVQDILAKRETLVKLHSSSEEHFVPLEEAREKCVKKSSFIPDFGKDILVKNIDPLVLEPLIDWRLFLAFWGFKDISLPEAVKCKEDALKVIREMGNVEIDVIAKFFDAGREDETVIIGGHRLNLGRSTSSLTQYESYADFIAKKGGRCGLFVIKVEDHHRHCDWKDYETLLRHSICARLASAAAEWLGQLLPPWCVFPAFGYQSCPDHKLKREAFELLDAEKELGLHLTESCAMIPETSICGMVIGHPQARYINFRREE